VPAVFLFTALTLVATLIHLEKFHLGSEFELITQAGTWVWLLIYATVPVAMIIMWIRQLRVHGIDPPLQRPISRVLRIILIIQATLMIVLGVSLFIAPAHTGELLWPWKLSALTGRAIGAWLIGIGTAARHMAYENDWWRVEASALAFWVFGALQLFTLARFASDRNPSDGELVLDWNDPRLWFYVLFLVVVVVVGLKGWLNGREVTLDTGSDIESS
jgi:hypothetical protein